MALVAAGARLLVGTMGQGIYSRTTGGPWTVLGHGPGDGIITALLLMPAEVLAGTDNGIYRYRLC
jgi:hypothetical protein